MKLKQTNEYGSIGYDHLKNLISFLCAQSFFSSFCQQEWINQYYLLINIEKVKIILLMSFIDIYLTNVDFLIAVDS
jgi:hypothetical protein